MRFLRLYLVSLFLCTPLQARGLEKHLNQLLGTDSKAAADSEGKLPGLRVNGGDIEDEEVMPLILQALKDPRHRVQKPVCQFLSQATFFNESIYVALFAIVSDAGAPPDVRAPALRAYAKRFHDNLRQTQWQSIVDHVHDLDALGDQAFALMDLHRARLDEAQWEEVLSALRNIPEQRRKRLVEILEERACQSISGRFLGIRAMEYLTAGERKQMQAKLKALGPPISGWQRVLTQTRFLLDHADEQVRKSAKALLKPWTPAQEAVTISCARKLRPTSQAFFARRSR